jgi:hypothetical protein
MSKSKVNPEEILKDIDEVFETIKNWEEDKISINELVKKSKKFEKIFEKHSKDLDLKK